MSTYYTIDEMKVRVSDHEPNFSMDRMRGVNDVEFYTVDAEGKKLDVASQVRWYCEKHDLDTALFSQVLEDYPSEEIILPTKLDKIEVSAEFMEGYRAISGKGSTKKKEKYCQSHGLDSYKVSQGHYFVK